MALVLDSFGRVVVIMAALLAVGLIMGQRHMGQLSLFDLLTSVTIGTVAGSGITEPQFRPLIALVGIAGLAGLDLAVAWFSVKWRGFGRAVTFEPLVVVRQGKPIRSAMRRLRMPLADLLPELRKKDVFDLREVEYAIFEPDGSLSVMKAPQAPKGKGLAQAIIVDGAVDEKVLHTLGWDQPRLLQELARQGFVAPEEVFVATLDEGGTLFAVSKSTPEAGTMHH